MIFHSFILVHHFGQGPQRGQCPVEHIDFCLLACLCVGSNFKVKRADFMPLRTDFRPQRADFRGEWPIGGTNGRSDRRMEG